MSADRGEAVTDLMTRNLLEVFGERDQAARRVAMGELYDPEVRFVDPGGTADGHDGIDDAAAQVLARFPDLNFAIAIPATSVGDLGRVTWELRTSEGVPKARGADVATVADGRITRMWTFLEALD